MQHGQGAHVDIAHAVPLWEGSGGCKTGRVVLSMEGSHILGMQVRMEPSQAFAHAHPVIRAKLAQICRATLYLASLMIVPRPAAPTPLGLRGGVLPWHLLVPLRALLRRRGGRAPVHSTACTRHTRAVRERSSASCLGETR